MCGIAGIFAYDHLALPVDVEELSAVRDAMAARGPDGADIWISKDRRIGFAHRRLAIIDLSPAGAQPMASADGSLVITFNGEIYNYRELRQSLERDGYRFRSQSDTEVLLALYEQHGEAMVHRLRGMYAFAIWDARHQCLFLARDPFGIKPLYYCDDGHTVRFASQVKALVRGNGVRLTSDPGGHVGFFIFGYVPEPRTLYRQIRGLAAGCTLSIRREQRPICRRFYDLAAKIAEAETVREAVMSDAEQVDVVTEALKDSVAHHLIADVPVGIFLSAGIDSNVIASTMRSVSDTDLLAITMGFGEFAGTERDEMPLAKAQADKLQMRHVARWVNREEFYRDVDKVWSAMDQPSIDGVNTWLVAKAAAEVGVKVCISGLGGDELFAGYPSFHQVPQLNNMLSGVTVPQAMKAMYRLLARALPEKLVSPKYSYALDHLRSLHDAYLLRRALFLPEELANFLDPQLVREGLDELDVLGSLERSVSGVRGSHATVSALELSWYMRSQLLRDADWAGMAHGVEVRVPMLDSRLFESLLPILASQHPPTKNVLLRAAGQKLLPALRTRAKTGFATPVRQWLEARYQRAGRYRGLRAWSRVVYAEFVPELSLLPADPIPPRLTGTGFVMIYRIGQLGDTLVSLPTFEAIRKQFPDSQVVLLTDRHPERLGLVSAWDVIGPTGVCDGVMYYDVFDHAFKNLAVYLRLRKRIRLVAPRAVINLAPRTRRWDERRDRFFFRFLCGVPVYRAVEIIPQLGRGTASGIARVVPEWSRLLRVIDSNLRPSTYNLPLPRWAKSEAAAVLGALPSEVKRIVAIGPGSKMPAKRWPIDRFEQFGEALLDESDDLGLIVLGGKEDRILGDRLCEAWGPRSANLAGELSVFGSAAALARCVAYVGNDSGTMHLAGMIGVPCVALFSSRDFPGKWEPYGDNHQVLRREVECAGCMLEVCDRANLCLTLIGIEDVLEGWHRISGKQAKALASGYQM
jgi:asparagine synthase (glutamine-hydrolysing)